MFGKYFYNVHDTFAQFEYFPISASIIAQVPVGLLNLIS